MSQGGKNLERSGFEGPPHERRRFLTYLGGIGSVMLSGCFMPPRTTVDSGATDAATRDDDGSRSDRDVAPADGSRSDRELAPPDAPRSDRAVAPSDIGPGEGCLDSCTVSCSGTCSALCSGGCGGCA